MFTGFASVGWGIYASAGCCYEGHTDQQKNNDHNFFVSSVLVNMAFVVMVTVRFMKYNEAIAVWREAPEPVSHVQSV